MVKHVLDLVKAQAFWAAEASTGFNKKPVTKSIGSQHVKNLLVLKYSIPIFCMLLGLGGLGMEYNLAVKIASFNKWGRAFHEDSFLPKEPESGLLE